MSQETKSAQSLLSTAQPHVSDGGQLPTQAIRKDESCLESIVEEEEGYSMPGSASYLEGWRLTVLSIGICLGIFLSTLEITIVSTSLVSISNSLSGFSISSWIVTSYLLTYTGFLIIIAKMSDIFGRKEVYVLVLVIFIVFSIGCGLSQNMNTIIVLRAFQGIGGGGVYAMAFVIGPEMVPTTKFALYAALLSISSALASLTGPLLGGAISEDDGTLWRWVFLLNGPAAGTALILVIIGLPNGFPKHRMQKITTFYEKFTLQNLQRIDIMGLFLLLGGSILMVTSLEEGGTFYSWRDPLTVTLLVVGCVLFILFLAWERFQEKRNSSQEPLFPWRLAIDRFAMGVLLNAFSVGATMTTVIIILPQRFQIVNGNSPFAAGYRLLTLTAASSVGLISASMLVQRLKIAHFWVLLGSAPLQILGLVLLGYSPTDYTAPPKIYAYQVIVGLGFGGTMAAATMMVPVVVVKKDNAVAMGAISQFRSLGGSVGIAIATNMIKSHVSSILVKYLSPSQLLKFHQSARTLEGLSLKQQEIIRHAYSEGFNRSMHVTAAFGVAALFATFLLCERSPRKQL